MDITRIAFLSAALTLLPVAAYSQGKPAAKDALLYFCLATGWRNYQRRILVPLRSPQHGGDPCG